MRDVVDAINQILKLKKQAIEKSLAEGIKSLRSIEDKIDFINRERENDPYFAGASSNAECVFSGADFQIAEKWQNQLTLQHRNLIQARSDVSQNIEALKSELKILTGKIELRDRQIKLVEIEHIRAWNASEDERKLESWRLGNVSKE